MRLSVIVFFISAFLMSCSIEKKANKAFILGKYQNSIDLYKKVVGRNANNGKANYFIAESYRLSNRGKEAEAYYAEAITIPMYPTMTETQQDEVVDAVKSALAS